MWDTALLVAALVCVAVVVGLVLVTFAARRREPLRARPRSPLGMAGGMLFGAALGTIVWLSTGEFVFWVIFLGGGLTLGLAIDAANASRTG